MRYIPHTEADVAAMLSAIGLRSLDELIHNYDNSGLLTMVVQESGESLMAILNDILDVSRIEARKLEIELLP